MCLSASLGAARKKERGHDLLGRFLRAGVGQVLATVRTGVGVRHCSLVPYRGRAKPAVRAIVAHQSCPRVPSEQSSFSFALHATQNLLEASRYDSLISKLGQVSNKSESGGLVATSLGLARAFEIVTEIRDRELLRAPKTVWITDFCGSRRAIFRNNTLRDRVRDWLLFCCVLCVFFVASDFGQECFATENNQLHLVVGDDEATAQQKVVRRRVPQAMITVNC